MTDDTDQTFLDQLRPPPTQEELMIQKEEKRLQDLQRQNQFKSYLSQYGLSHILTDILTDFYESYHPMEHPIEYIQHKLSTLDGNDINVINKENEELKIKIEDAKKKLQELEEQLQNQE